MIQKPIYNIYQYYYTLHGERCMYQRLLAEGHLGVTRRPCSLDDRWLGLRLVSPGRGKQNPWLPHDVALQEGDNPAWSPVVWLNGVFVEFIMEVDKLIVVDKLDNGNQETFLG